MRKFSNRGIRLGGGPRRDVLLLPCILLLSSFPVHEGFVRHAGFVTACPGWYFARPSASPSIRCGEESQRRRFAYSRRSVGTLPKAINDNATDSAYSGPVLEDPNSIVAGLHLPELGIDLAIAPSSVAPGSLGLYAALSEGVEASTVPALSLLCGYSREGRFEATDEGDKTVAFVLAGPNTAVFYERQLMSIVDALALAGSTVGNNGCGLAGHVLVQEDDREGELVEMGTGEGNGIGIYPIDDTSFLRYYVPDLLNHHSNEAGIDAGLTEEAVTVQNFGQFCNDLAWNFNDPPTSKESYDGRSESCNIVQLMWRLEFDPVTNCLVPSWPVSVTARDVTLTNTDVFMELGTKYGWNYWQATVDLENITS